jgi:hypothetical protein
MAAAPQLVPTPARLGAAAASEGMVSRRLSVLAADVVYVKGIIEASEGLASLFADEGGELTIAAPHGRETELLDLLEDLQSELRARVQTDERSRFDVCHRPG